MLEEIKKELLKLPDIIASILEDYDYTNIKIHDGYMSFGRDAQSSPKSIVIYLDNNDWLYVKDYARNINKDLFGYIVDQRGVSFSNVMECVKSHLGITDFYAHYQPKKAFGGFYSRIKNNKTGTTPVKIYDKSILDQYSNLCNIRFLRDNISLTSQKFFGIRYDVENGGIIIPIYDQLGELIAIKERIDREPRPDEQKYWYVIPGRESKTLYGYCQNYNYLVDNTIYIFESEKSCMQCHTFGVQNCVSLGCGSISYDQVRMIYELNPQRVVFLHDYGYEDDYILRNVELFKNYNRFSEVEIGYWNWKLTKRDGKVSPSDLGKTEFNRIINEEIKWLT